MDDDHLENWGANLGFIDDEESAASVMLEFGLDEALTYDVEIPEGTEVTAGDDVFFATDKTVVISAGETSISVSATCTETGTAGNGYSLGQISEISDSLPYVSYVKNTSISDFGKEKSTGDDLREKIFLYPSTYSTAGPEDEYIYYVKQYSESIVDVNIEADAEATVNIWVMLQNGQLPNEEYCALVKNFIEELKCTPDTDKINVRIPEASEYELSLTYYISKSSRDNESEIKEKVEDAIQSYIEYQYSGLGIDINPDVLIEKIRAAGAKRVEMTTPTYKKLEKGQVAICTEKNILYGGLEED
jgi:phage-related baseplate assembly protein